MLGVSVIIPNYNMAAYVGAAIESALAQDHPLVEVIVVDDASSDGSREIISAYADRARLLLLEDNLGQSAALNAAWAIAKHPIIIFLDADDLLLPHAASRLAGVFTETTAKVQFCLQTIDASGRTLDHVAPKFPANLDTATIRSELLRTGSSPAAQGSGNAYARWMLERVQRDGGFSIPGEKRLWMDAILEINAPFYGEVLTLPEPLACYRMHDTNWSGHAEISAAKFARMVEFFQLKLAYLARRCAAWGVEFDHEAAKWRALWAFEYMVAAAKLDPNDRPEGGPRHLLWPAIRACATSVYPVQQKLLRGAWIAAVSLLPRPVASRLISWRFIVHDRPQWIEGVVRRR